MMTPYSVLMTAVWSSLFILVLFLCRRNTKFIMHFGAVPLLFLFGGCILRCFFPLDFPSYTRVIESPGWFTDLNTFFDRPLSGMPFDLYTVLGIVWLCGTVLMLGRMGLGLAKSISFLSKLKSTDSPLVQEVLERVSQRMQIRGARVIQLDDVNVPVILFHLHPTVLLPTISYTEKELDFVLTHELTHWKNRDLLVKLLVQLCCAFFWWNPLVYLLRRDLEQTLELKCDLALTKNLEEQEKVEYLETILKTMRHAPRAAVVPLTVAAAELTDGSDAKRMKQRFHLILDYIPNPRKERIFTAFLGVFVAASLAFSFAFVVQPHYDPPQEDFYNAGGAGEIIPENSYLMKAPDGDYVMYVEGREMSQRIPEELVSTLLKEGFVLKE